MVGGHGRGRSQCQCYCTLLLKQEKVLYIEVHSRKQPTFLMRVDICFCQDWPDQNKKNVSIIYGRNISPRSIQFQDYYDIEH